MACPVSTAALNPASLSACVRAVELTNIPTANVEQFFDWRHALRIGKGNFGEVYKAVCIEDHDPEGFSGIEKGVEYAVKVIKIKTNWEKRDIKAIFHEIEVLKLLQSEFCIRLFDAFKDQRYIYIVMELVKGGELFDVIIRRKQISEVETRFITKQLLKALEYLHGQSIAHRDLKPENILIDEQTLEIKLIDFGLSKFFGSAADSNSSFTPIARHALQRFWQDHSPAARTPGTLSELSLVSPCGTPGYCAPEIYSRMVSYGFAPRVTTRTDIQKLDIFAVGVVVYVMLGGNFPFDSTNPKGFVQKIKDGVKFPDRMFSKVSFTACQFCEWLMHYDRNKRPLASEALKHPWFQNKASTEPYKISEQAVDNGIYEEARKAETKEDKEEFAVMMQIDEHQAAGPAISPVPHQRPKTPLTTPLQVPPPPAALRPNSASASRKPSTPPPQGLGAANLKSSPNQPVPSPFLHI